MKMDEKGEIKFDQRIETFEGYSEQSGVGRVFGKNSSIQIVEGLGVFMYTIAKDRKARFTICFFGENDQGLTWAYSSKGMVHKSAEFLGVKGFTLFSLVYEEINKFRNYGNRGYVMGIDIGNGKKIFYQKVTEEPVGLSPLTFKYQPKTKDVYLGAWNYIIKESKFLNPKASKFNNNLENIPGYLIAKLNIDGTISERGQIGFKTLENDINLATAGRSTKFCLHNIITTKGKKNFLVLETYQGSLNKKTIKDFVIVELDKNFKAIQAKIFPKMHQKSKVGIRSINGSTLGDWNQNFYLKENGLDYSFTVFDDSDNNFMIGYLSDDNLKKENQINKIKKRKGTPSWSMGTIRYINNAYSQQEIDLESDADDVFLLPGNFENVVVMEYYKKEKKFEMRIINITE